MNNFMKELRKEKGAALLLTLFFIVISLALGVTLLTLSLKSRETVTSKERQLQAYYIARSGADTVAQAIINKDYNSNFETPETAEGQLGEGSFAVKTSKVTDDDEDLLLESTGRVGKTSQKITLNLQKPWGSGQLFDTTIFSNNDVNLYKDFSEVHENVSIESRGIIDDADKLSDGNKEEYSNRTFPEVDFPDYPLHDPDSINDSSVSIDHENNKKSFTNIKVTSNGVGIEFDTTVDNKISLVVDEMSLHGNLEIIGDGVVELYINKRIDIHTKHAGTNHNLIVYLHPESEFVFNSGSTFEGFIYGPQASVDMNSSNTEFYGAMIVDEFQGTPHGFMGYVEHFDMENPEDFLGLPAHYERKLWGDG